MFNKKEWNTQHYLENKERILKRIKQYYKNHRAEILKYYREHKQTLKSRFTVYRANAKARDLIFGITFDEFVELTKKPCHYCGEEGFGIDRLDNTIGYLRENVVSCCSICNMMKRAYTKEDFINQCMKISNNWKGK